MQVLHARQLLALPEVTINAVADTSAKNREDFIEKFGLDAAGQFSDYQEMLEHADIDAVLLWTTGLTPVEAEASCICMGRPSRYMFTSIRFAEGAVAGLNLVGYAPCWHETFVFCGEDGGIFYDNGKMTLRRLGQESIVPELPKQTTNQDKSFIDAILGRHEILVPGEFALKVVKLSEMIYKAAGDVPDAAIESVDGQSA